MVKNVLVVRRTGGKIDWAAGRDLWYHDEMGKAPKPNANLKR